MKKKKKKVTDEVDLIEKAAWNLMKKKKIK